jgi:MoaA/NifB/PqqE/SkfB family radical SAM enzyme
LITNGQLLANPDFLASLADAGLDQVHVSLHSCRRETQDFLTQTPGSLQHIEQTLANCGQVKVPVSINTVINHYNADHLHENVAWIVDRYPFVRHVVWNNLDPHMNRVQSHPDTIPQFQDFEISLFRAASFLRQAGRSFRIERVPLCYMTEFAEYSTETRKIVKAEKRDTYFLDPRGHYCQGDFYYDKADVCAHCSVNGICAGVYGGGTYFSLEQVYPLFVDPLVIARRVADGE